WEMNALTKLMRIAASCYDYRFCGGMGKTPPDMHGYVEFCKEVRASSKSGKTRGCFVCRGRKRHKLVSNFGRIAR
ncbi:MAG: hypothetical protein AABY22_34470, partial [Nanoarchaeota archaeon]